MTTAREYLVEAATRLSRRGTEVFTLDEIVAEARLLGSMHRESTLRTMTTSHLCANAPDNAATTYDDFVRVTRGRYRLNR